MARPDSTRNSSERLLICEMVPAEPTTNTISQAKASTTRVRNAVAISESVLRMPHLAKIDVRPAKTADKTAATSHIMKSAFEPENLPRS